MIQTLPMKHQIHIIKTKKQNEQNSKIEESPEKKNPK